MKDTPELKAKRRKLVEILVANHKAKLELATRYQELDVNLSKLFETSPETLKRDVSRLSEDHVDTLIAHHSLAAGPRYVW